VFGDLFLEDVRRYREQSFLDSGLTPIFPLWQRPTAEVAQDLLTLGVRAAIRSVDPEEARRDIAGRWYDEDLLASLPPDVTRVARTASSQPSPWTDQAFLDLSMLP
jgi:diphthamide synthase (EF-2-diphthine--ammonia ligase)